MTHNLTDAEKEFLEYNWENSNDWKHYYNNLFPTPPPNKVPKYKRTWFKRHVNPKLPADSTVGDIEYTSTNKSTTATEDNNKKPTTTNNAKTTMSFTMTIDLLVKLELAARLVFIASTVILVFFRLAKLIPPRILLPVGFAYMTSFFMFLLIALFKDKGKPSWSIEYARILLMDDNLHYLTYGLSIINTPKTLVIMGPQLLTCLLGLQKLHRQYNKYIPKNMIPDSIKPLWQQLDKHTVNILGIRGTMEAAILFHMLFAMFTSVSSIMSLVLYTNFIKLKVAMNDVYLIGAFSQLNSVIWKVISHPSVPSFVQSGYSNLTRTVLKYFQPQRR
ncbi:hypothetical protein BBOV_II007610 [Babesia bovis T2Bo]|uniref:hypothetical protein n=1 Tax=Babesia bovis T2Bo TaxID=484906 RepID=UPI001C36AFDC|nr:hypothetical protein BBOV_II007610 [Babesia bovis T2Bo]EDO06711.2 hypothetical protein BBOV_II007610 [Babesia bovis T2Bo]